VYLCGAAGGNDDAYIPVWRRGDDDVTCLVPGAAMMTRIYLCGAAGGNDDACIPVWRRGDDDVT